MRNPSLAHHPTTPPPSRQPRKENLLLTIITTATVASSQGTRTINWSPVDQPRTSPHRMTRKKEAGPLRRQTKKNLCSNR